jgi:hypothetical protein
MLGVDGNDGTVREKDFQVFDLERIVASPPTSTRDHRGRPPVLRAGHAGKIPVSRPPRDYRVFS